MSAEPTPEDLVTSMEQLQTKAAHDLKNRPPGALTEWVFLHARARGKQLIADRALKRIEGEQSMVMNRATYDYYSEAAMQLILTHAPGPLAFHRAEVTLADATAEVVATERVLELLMRPRATTELPKQEQAAPPVRAVQGGKR